MYVDREKNYEVWKDTHLGKTVLIIATTVKSEDVTKRYEMDCVYHWCIDHGIKMYCRVIDVESVIWLLFM